MIGSDLDKCDEIADKYAPLIEFGVIQTSKWHKEWDGFHHNYE